MLKFLADRKNQLIIIAVLTFLAYVNIFRNEFVIDDRTFIVDWQAKNSFGNIVEFFRGAVPPGHEGVYRPIRSLLYALDWQLFGASPFGYHLQAIAIHVASTVLVYLIVETLISADLKRRLALMPFIAALLFGLHPIHTETITYIASSVESLGIVFYLASFWLYLKVKERISTDVKRMMQIGSVVLAGLAFFTSELTLTLPLVLILADYTLMKKPISADVVKSAFLKFTPYFALAGIYLLIRFVVLDIGNRGPYLADSVYLTALTMFKVFTKYLSLVILPLQQANNHIISPGIEAFVYRNYRTEAIRAQSIADISVLFGILLLAVLVFVAIKTIKNHPIVAFSLFWFLITLLPVSEIVPQGSMLNEKFLYLPSLGFVLVAAYVICELGTNIKRIDPTSLRTGMPIGALVVVGIIALGYGFLTVRRNFDWHDSVRLWTKDVEAYPEDNAYGYFQLGNAYASIGQAELAIGDYQKAYEINPNFVVTLASIGRTYNDAGNVDVAISFYKKSVSQDPYFWEARNNLGTIYTKRAEFDLARKEYEQILLILPNFSQVQQALDALPVVREATMAGKISEENVWLSYYNLPGQISLRAPATWRVSRYSQKSFAYPSLTISDKEDFTATLSVDQKKTNVTFEDYLKEQKDTHGTLNNEGLALVPGYERAYVKVWIEEQRDTSIKDIENKEGITKLQFFLFSGSKVIEIVASPADSPSMQIFEIVMGSMKVNAN